MRRKLLLLNICACAAFMFAKLGAGTCCYGFLYQPRMPDKLRK